MEFKGLHSMSGEIKVLDQDKTPAACKYCVGEQDLVAHGQGILVRRLRSFIVVDNVEMVFIISCPYIPTFI